MTYDELEARIAQWAATQPSIRAVIVIGSRARGTADPWSDLDMVLFTTEREPLAASSDWLHLFGDLWLAYREMTGGGDPEWYALYEEVGLKLDLLLQQVEQDTPDLETLLAQHSYKGVFARGFRVLYESRGEPRTIPPQPFVQPDAPTREAFDELVLQILIDTLTAAKFVARGDFWRAQRWFAQFLRPQTMTLIEWQAYGKDTWFTGRFVDQWADPRALAALPQIFARYEREGLQQAIRALLDLLRWLGEENAAHFGYAYPGEVHEHVARLVEATFAI